MSLSFTLFFLPPPQFSWTTHIFCQVLTIHSGTRQNIIHQWHDIRYLVVIMCKERRVWGAVGGDGRCEFLTCLCCSLSVKLGWWCVLLPGSRLSHLEDGGVVNGSEHFICAEPYARLCVIYLIQFSQHSHKAGAVILMLPAIIKVQRSGKPCPNS